MSLGKKSNGAAAASPTSLPRPADARDASAGPEGRSAALSGILAGQVIDSYNQRPAGVYIQVQEAGQAAAAPVEVAADSQGYFTIQSLQPGHHYQLTARQKSGDRLMAGTTYATPPDPKVLIHISEDFATATTPPPPTAPSVPGGGAPGADSGWSPLGDRSSNGRVPRRAADIGPPVGVPQNQPPLRPESITQNGLAVNSPTLADIPPQARGNPYHRPGADNLTMPAVGQAVVPSCVLTGQTLSNFALLDLNGQPWEYQRNRRGRLTLIDFWGTWCAYCMQAIPHLNMLQDRYGPAGLEVVGIAYEDGNFMQQVAKVNRARQMRQIRYQVLLGGDRDRCPVRTQFSVLNWPTLVLLDENGRIIWRGEGLDAQQFRELDVIIHQRLGIR
jgi:thiol-disulfide isomerase/thioredoxin